MPYKLKSLLSEYAPAILTLILFVTCWHLLVQWGQVSPYLLPSPVQVIKEAQLNSKELFWASVTTGLIAISGLLLSLLTGILISFVMAQAKFIERSIYPYAIFLQAVPIIAIAPIIILWFGPGTRAMIIISFIISLFPIITNSTAGLTQIEPEYLELMQLYKANWWQRLIKMRIPSAIPHIVTGVKISAGLSVVGAIIGEYFTGVSGQAKGLAYLIRANEQNANYPYLFATTFAAAGVGLAIFVSVSLLGDKLVKIGRFSKE